MAERGGEGAVRWPCACKLSKVSESYCGAVAWTRACRNRVAEGSSDYDGARLYTFASGAMSSSRPRVAKRPREGAASKELYAPANADDVKAFLEMGSQASKLPKQPSANGVAMSPRGGRGCFVFGARLRQLEVWLGEARGSGGRERR